VNEIKSNSLRIELLEKIVSELDDRIAALEAKTDRMNEAGTATAMGGIALVHEIDELRTQIAALEAKQPAPEPTASAGLIDQIIAQATDDFNRSDDAVTAANRRGLTLQSIAALARELKAEQSAPEPTEETVTINGEDYDKAIGILCELRQELNSADLMFLQEYGKRVSAAINLLTP
jgi:cell division protein ZapA (FtsZ GTPase activity inhibitor)